MTLLKFSTLLSLTSLVLITTSFSSEKHIIHRYAKAKIVGTEKTIEGRKVHIYRGIPFADSPTGNRRWTVTSLKDLPKNGSVNATKFGNICPYQILPKLKEDYGPKETLARLKAMNEDCLYLNVWKPANIQKGKKLPVLFVIHGGGFVRNSTREGKIDGAALAAKGAIVVSAEYRLGPLGFFNHSSFQKNSFWGNTNFGLTDQVQALRWVKRNISYLGGNAGNVTIMGGSAGGASVYYHLSSKISKYFYNQKHPLFHKAISIGGGGFGNLLPRKSLSTKNQSAQKIADNFLKSLKDNPNARCSKSAHKNIRNKTYRSLLNSSQPLGTIMRQCPTVAQLTNHFGFKLNNDNKTISKAENRRYPYIDDSTVMGDGSLPILLNNPNAFLPIPLINGAARNEAEVLEYLQNDPLKSVNWLKNSSLKKLNTPQLLYKIAEMYGVHNKSYLNRKNNFNYFKSHFAKLFYGDGTFNQPANIIAKTHNKRANTYSYIYAYQPAAHTMWRKWQYNKKLNGIDDLYKLRYAMNDAGHTNEFFTFFGNLDARLKKISDIKNVDRAFSSKVQQYLLNFMNTGNPNSGPYKKLTPWPRNRNGKTLQHLGVQWIANDASNIKKPVNYHIGPLYNHKSKIFDYFESFFKQRIK